MSKTEDLSSRCAKALNSAFTTKRNKDLISDLIAEVTELEFKSSIHEGRISDLELSNSRLEHTNKELKAKLSTVEDDKTKTLTQHNRQMEIAKHTGRKEILNQLEDGIMPDDIAGWRSTKNNDYLIDMVKVDIANRVIEGWKVSGKPEFIGFWWHPKNGYERMTPEEQNLLVKNNEG